MHLISYIPLFAYILVAANVVMLTGSPEAPNLNIILTQFDLPTGPLMIITVSDLFILVSFFILYIETLKATRTTRRQHIDHVLSLAVFIIAIIEFLISAAFGNMTFLIIMVAMLMDVVIGVTVTIATAKRDISVD